jgi:valacyclovir hydrolase
LLLHGWLQVGRELLPLARELAANYRVVLPDLPGYGRSTPPNRIYPADFYERDARIMCEFVDTLKLKDIAVLGYSDGGEVALIMGVSRPELCRCVVTWGAMGHLTPELCDYAQNVIAPLNMGQSERKLHPKQDISKWPQAWAEGFCAMIAAGGDVSLSRAANIRNLLLMVGDLDKLNPPEAARQFVETANLENQKSCQRMFQLFTQTGHGIHDERPVQFTETVREFLKSTY